MGRLEQLTDGSGNVIVTYTYDADGRLSKKVNGNGTYTTYQYDTDGNVLHLFKNYAPDRSINSRFDYTYNALGLETTEATLDGTWTYTYDADAQLVHAVFASTNPSVPSQDLAYSYDAMGNRIATVINGATTGYVTNNMNEYTSVGGVAYSYDANGNLLSDGTITYTYNSLNELTSVTGPGGATSHTYNALGQRVASTTNGVTTQYEIDPSGLGNVVGEYAGNGTLVMEYSYGLGLVSEVGATGNAAYYNFDAAGNTASITNVDGQPLNQYVYLPFGQTTNVVSTLSPNLFTVVGQFGVLVDESGLSFMQARFLNPELGRFITQDPAGGSTNDNLYAYGNNDPIDQN